MVVPGRAAIKEGVSTGGSPSPKVVTLPLLIGYSMS